MQKLMGLVRRCIEDYNMISNGDRIAIGVSGGKDSLGLLTLMAGIQPYFPKSFTLEAFTVDLGFNGMDFSPIQTYCEAINVPFSIIHTNISQIVFDVRKEHNPCSLCAKMRRGALHNTIASRGISKIALGHHMDDAIETFYLSLFYEGRISCFEPVTYLDRSKVIQIRPLLYVGEKALINLAQQLKLPVIKNICPADKHTRRQEIKELISKLSLQYPDLKSKTFGAIQHYPLSNW